MIIVAGCDNTGKTSLVNHIRDKFKIAKGERFHTLPPRNKGEWEEWYHHMKRQFIMDLNIVYDRLFIDEFVYGPLMRGGYKIGIEKMAELTGLMLIAQPIIIHCWLPMADLLKSYEERKQVFNAYEASQIATDYDEVIYQYPINQLKVISFNYKHDPDYRDIDIRLQGIISNWRDK